MLSCDDDGRGRVTCYRNDWSADENIRALKAVSPYYGNKADLVRYDEARVRAVFDQYINRHSPRVPIFYDSTQSLQENGQRLVDFDVYFSPHVEEATTENEMRSLFHECFLDMARDFADQMLEGGREDVYYGLMVGFLARAEQTVNTEEVAAEFADIRRLYSKSRNRLVENIYSTRENADFVLAYRREYYKK